jgi:phosphate starvation-inducible PhoH-like protein
VIGSSRSAQAAIEMLKKLYIATAEERLTSARVHLHLQDSGVDELLSGVQSPPREERPSIRTRRGMIRVRGANQGRYVDAIRTRDLTFGVGPAGTGKTYLAVACAVEALESEMVRRLVLVRPAVEAGERLGFLPGDLSQKIEPYLRPMYDALFEMLGFEKVAKLIERNVIEIAPLAYMRGRTLNESFVILDEAQNTTLEQMKMFLTRIGYGSKAVVNGDVTQVDLPDNRKSGLRQVIDVLRDVDGISFNFFVSRDVVRHPLVQRIIEAYERSETASETGK